jgi:tRNA modification GTPase
MPLLPLVVFSQMTASNTIAIFNKTDLVTPSLQHALPRNITPISVSSLTGIGFEELQSLIVKKADSFRLDSGEELIAINARHAYALESATECLFLAKEKLERIISTELVASDLRDALNSFGEISGKIDNETVLDQLFSNFCIGK